MNRLRSVRLTGCVIAAGVVMLPATLFATSAGSGPDAMSAADTGRETAAPAALADSVLYDVIGRRLVGITDGI